MAQGQIIIDKRPLTTILIERSGRFLVLLGLFFLLYLFLKRDPWQGLDIKAYRAIGAFLFCSVLWVTQLLPLAITGLLAIIIIPLLNILPADSVFSYFGNEAVFFILGALILAAAIMKTGLATRLSLFLLKNSSDSPKKLIFRILTSTALLSCIMPEHAVAAFFFPIILEIVRSLEFVPFGGNYGKSLFLAMAWGCVIGGVVTFLGGARTPLAIGIYHEMTGQSLGFYEWMKTSLFVAVPMLLLAYFVLTRFIAIDVESVNNAHKVLLKKIKQIGRADLRERLVGLILFGSVILWMTKSHQLGIANIAIAAVVALFILKLVNWKDVEEYVNWGIILMYGGAIALGRAVDSTGALEWLSLKVLVVPSWLAQTLGGSPGFWLICVLSLLVILLTEVVSNAAVVALLMPISISLVHSFGLDPSTAIYAVALPSGLAFILPISTPAIAIAYSSGYLKLREILWPGFVLMILGWFFFVMVTKWIWPLLGIQL